MAINYDEKRDFIRMDTDHDLQFHEIGSSENRNGTCVNLSASGIMFMTEEELATGSQLEINITPQYSVVSPFDATIEVIRTHANGTPGRYAVAGKITSIRQ